MPASALTCNDDRMTDFRPTASLETLARRAALLREVRRFFDERGFLEVTTPLLSRDTVVDRHLDPFRVTVFADPRTPTEGPTWFLQTSPEFHMKRLLAAGATAIYQITQVFRAAEVGAHHNLEFTMLEWYRVGDDMRAGMDLLAEFIETVADTGPTDASFVPPGVPADPRDRPIFGQPFRIAAACRRWTRPWLEPLGRSRRRAGLVAGHTNCPPSGNLAPHYFVRFSRKSGRFGKNSPRRCQSSGAI